MNARELANGLVAALDALTASRSTEQRYRVYVACKQAFTVGASRLRREINEERAGRRDRRSLGAQRAWITRRANAGQEPVNRARPGTKNHLIGELLLRPEGVTSLEICEAVGWPAVSVPQHARQCGLPLYTQRIGGVRRYYARQPS